MFLANLSLGSLRLAASLPPLQGEMFRLRLNLRLFQLDPQRGTTASPSSETLIGGKEVHRFGIGDSYFKMCCFLLAR
jgi:hypothetical protein